MPNPVHADGYSEVTSALIRARNAAGMTQAELARRLGKPQSFVSKIERGERRLDIVELAAVARALGISDRGLLGEILDALPAALRI